MSADQDLFYVRPYAPTYAGMRPSTLSEQSLYGKYDFQHLQGALRCVYGHQKPDVLRVYNEDQSGWGPNGIYFLFYGNYHYTTT